MSSAKWQRHSTFLSVKWRISEVADVDWPRASGVGVSGERGGALASLWQSSSGGASTGRPVAAPPGKEGGLSARDMAPPPGQLSGGARTANGAVRGGGGGGLSGVSAPGASA